MTTAFDRFRASLPPFSALHQGIIGRDAVLDGPFGPRRLIYADYVASGRAHEAIEGFILREVLPFYANSHTEASHCGGTMTRLRREARGEILRLTGGGPDHAVVFTGAGATAGINRLVHLWDAGRATVILGPYEHHSNILPWRESGARIVTLPEADCGGPCPNALREALRGEGPHIVALSAASNITGIIADVAGLTAIAKQAGARIVWDYAGAAPYLPIDLSLGMDAVVTSPHKFLGGPGASGVMILRRDSVEAVRPSLPGGGTVRFVNDAGHDYATAIESREESGTPNVVGDIRAALCFVLKDAAGQAAITARNKALWARAKARLDAAEGVELLGKTDCPRLPILSFRIADGRGGHVHQQLATRILSDLYGVQARGGCACAGPYVHRLLSITPAQSAAMRAAILRGDEIEKPGFVRLNLCWAAPETEIEAILTAICDLPQSARGLAPRYCCDEATAIFRPLAAE
ncbi:MAG: aminotransferase class V-fold PLP-dependent enzyme [Paracoccus sp. (in: a-proteobacteria)]|nr:aminotransferase class V-fold PLP-dependent enzyme [Paracoccus sp. (in: a-proteobacteria)]